MGCDVTYTDIIYKVLYQRRRISSSSSTTCREQFAYTFLAHIRHQTYVHHVCHQVIVISTTAHTSVLLSNYTTNEHCGFNPTVMVTGGETLRNGGGGGGVDTGGPRGAGGRRTGGGGGGGRLYQGVPMGSMVQKWYGR